LGTGPAYAFILKNLEPGGPENVKNRVWNWTGGFVNFFKALNRNRRFFQTGKKG
jgi:hypothetical protein